MTYFIYWFPNLFLRLYSWKYPQISVLSSSWDTGWCWKVNPYIYTYSVQLEFEQNCVCNNCHLTVFFSDHIHSDNRQLGHALQTVLHYMTVWTFKHHTGSKPLPQRFHNLLPLLKEPQDINFYSYCICLHPTCMVAWSQEWNYRGTNTTVIYDTGGFECSRCGVTYMHSVNYHIMQKCMKLELLREHSSLCK